MSIGRRKISFNINAVRQVALFVQVIDGIVDWILSEVKHLQQKIANGLRYLRLHTPLFPDSQQIQGEILHKSLWLDPAFARWAL